MSENEQRESREAFESNLEPAVGQDGAVELAETAVGVVADCGDSRNAAPADLSTEAAALQPDKKRTVLWAIAMLLCLVALVVGAGLTYSAFTANDYLKSVEVTRPSQSLFASDVLASYTSVVADEKVAVRPLTADTDSASDKCQVSFRIYNCMLDDPNVFNDKEVKYTLSVDAVGAESGQWSISPGIGTYETPATRGEIKTFTITFDKSLLDKCSFIVKATVDTSSSPGTSLAMLAANIAPAQRAEVQSASVRGAWEIDDSLHDVPSDYDAYSYRVMVTGQKKTVKLTWGEAVELDPFFEKNHSGCFSDRPNRTVTFDMEPGSEIVNFFCVGTVPDTWEGFHVSAVEA